MSVSKRRRSGVEPRPTGSKIRPTQRRRIKATTRRVTVNAAELARRKFLHLAAGAAALSAWRQPVKAQNYPRHPVRLISSFAAGGGNDILARLIGQWLSERTGQQFIVDNRPGAGGNIGTEAVVRAPADGHTLLLAGAFNAINATLYEKLNFNFSRDIAPVAGIIRVPNIMEVNPSFPAKTVPEFIAYAKANPSKINFASGGTGTAPHLSGELFKMLESDSFSAIPLRA